jgi:hypothetical protein
MTVVVILGGKAAAGLALSCAPEVKSANVADPGRPGGEAFLSGYFRNSL